MPRDALIMLVPVWAGLVAMAAAAAGAWMRVLAERRRERARAEAEAIQWAATVARLDPDQVAEIDAVHELLLDDARRRGGGAR